MYWLYDISLRIKRIVIPSVLAVNFSNSKQIASLKVVYRQFGCELCCIARCANALRVTLVYCSYNQVKQYLKFFVSEIPLVA